jgi:hypothetical protein
LIFVPSIVITPTDTNPRLPAQPEHAVKQLRDLRLVAAAELRDPRVIRRAHRADHLVGHVLPTRPLDPARRPVPARVRVHQQGDHHRRVIRSTAGRTKPIRLREARQIHLIHRPNTVHTKWFSGNQSVNDGGINNN